MELLVLIPIVIGCWVIGIISWMSVAETCAEVAVQKGRHPDRWYVLGLLFGGFALAVLRELPSERLDLPEKRDEYVECSACHVAVRRRIECSNCHATLSILAKRVPRPVPPPPPPTAAVPDDWTWRQNER